LDVIPIFPSLLCSNDWVLQAEPLASVARPLCAK